MEDEDRETMLKLAQRSDEVERRARMRARMAKWDTNLLVILFSILVIVIILLFQGVRPEIVAVIAFLGLMTCWFTATRQEKQIYRRFYEEEWQIEKLLYERSRGETSSK